MGQSKKDSIQTTQPDLKDSVGDPQKQNDSQHTNQTPNDGDKTDERSQSSAGAASEQQRRYEEDHFIDDTPREAAVKKDVAGYIHRLIKQLPEQYKTVLTLYHLDRKSECLE